MSELRQKVIFIDDDEMFVDALNQWKSTLDLPVRTTTNPQDVLEWVDEGGISMVVADLRMPNTDGISVLEKVRHANDSAALVLLTAFQPTVAEQSRLRAIRAVVRNKAELSVFLDELRLRIPVSYEVTRQHGTLESTRAYKPSALLYTVFLSYGGPDEKAARAIYDCLTALGADVFFFPESATPGKRLHRTMSEGIQHYERVLLLCSKQSLTRSGVLNEIEQVLAREAAEGGAELLIPIALDDYVYSGWAPSRADLALQIRNRVIADFRNKTLGTPAFAAAIERVLLAIMRPDDAAKSPSRGKNSAPAKRSIFLSYSEVAQKHAAILASCLMNDFHVIEYLPSERYDSRQQLQRLIAQADYFIGIWCEDPQKRGEVSPWLPYELGIATALAKPFIVVVSKRVNRDVWQRIQNNLSIPPFDDVNFTAITIPSIIEHCKANWKQLV